MFYVINLRKRRKLLIVAILLVVLAILAVVAFNIRYPLKYSELIIENSELYGLEPAFVCAVIHAESKFEKKALSNKGASGLMQITEATGEWLAGEMDLDNYSAEDIFDPAVNISMGCYYLSRLLSQYDMNAVTALAAYNAGSGNVAKWLNNPDYSTGGTLTYIPFEETRNYIERVNFNYKIYKWMLMGRN